MPLLCCPHRDALHWQPCTVTTESGRELPAQYAMLMEHDPHAEAMYIMHWRLGKLCCTFKVRIRRGWERLRDFLVRVSMCWAVVKVEGQLGPVSVRE
jgi:hypothetical protein